MKKKRLISAVTALAITAGVLLAPGTAGLAEAAGKNNSQAEKILAGLTAEQRTALEALTQNDLFGLHIPSDVDLNAASPVSVIVEFVSRPGNTAVLEAAVKGEVLSLEDAEAQVAADHETFRADLETMLEGEQYTLGRSYDTVFNGVSLRLPANRISSLLKSKAVKAVYTDAQISIDPPVEEDGEKAHVPGTVSNNDYLGVELLHEEGITGAGIKVGVIDTGIDYNHPDLAEAYKGGYDFVDNDDDPMETTYADWKEACKSGYKQEFVRGNAYYTSHGTHVSGIIAGRPDNDGEYRMEGVAPDADLYVYRVLGAYGSGSTENILGGIEKSVEDGMDVINLSLGRDANDPMYATSIAVNNAVLHGVTAVVAAGNSGDGMYTLGSPAAAALALAVGASESPIPVATYTGTAAAGDQTASADLQLMAKDFPSVLSQLAGKSFKLVDGKQGSPKDYTQAQAEGNAILIQRGELTLADKVYYAMRYNAALVIIYNTDQEEGVIPVYLGEGDRYIPAFSVNKEQGEAMKAMLESGQEVTFTFGEMGETSLYGDVMAPFSSRGPARLTYDVKPEVTAPGVNVLSTAPSFIYTKLEDPDYTCAYQRMSGTSMAAPHVAGVAALMLQANPDLTPEDVKTVLMNTADPLKEAYSVYEMGAGRVDAYEAVHADVKVQVHDTTPVLKNGRTHQMKELSGGVTFGTFTKNGKDGRDQRTVVLTNAGDSAKTFDVTVNFQSSLRGSLDAAANGVKVTTNSTVKIKAGGHANTNLSVFVPKTAAVGSYEGYVVYTNTKDPEETYQVPFAIRVAEEGIREFGYMVPTMSTSETANANLLYMYFELKSHMKTIDVVLCDGDGNELGYCGSLDGTLCQEGVKEGYFTFDGGYYPFTGNKKQPISAKPQYVSEGLYSMKLITKTDDGKTFVETAEFYVDNSGPEMITSLGDPVVIEYPAGTTTVEITGNVFDKDVETMQQLGLSIDQSANKVAFYRNMMSPDAVIPCDAEGNFSLTAKLLEPSPMTPMKFIGMDAAMNVTQTKEVFFLREGMVYNLGGPDKVGVAPGETVTYTISANNLEAVSGASYSFMYRGNNIDVVDMALAPEFAAQHDAELTWSKTSGAYPTATANITIHDEGGVSGDMPMIQLVVKVLETDTTSSTGTFNRVQSTFTDVNGKQIRDAQNFVRNFYIYQPTSTLQAYFVAEGFLKEDYTFDFGKDYSVLDVAARLIAPDGTVTEGEINKTGYVQFVEVPISRDPYTLEITIPGHFPMYETIQIGHDVEGVFCGYFQNYTFQTYGGDVNEDNVIDLMDALEIQKQWGTDNRSADINYDGVVDAKDMQYIIYNFGAANPTTDTAPVAVEKYKGKTLDSILKALMG